jgi:hypothetical protein
MASYDDDDKTRIGKSINDEIGDTGSSQPPWMTSNNQPAATPSPPAGDSAPPWMSQGDTPPAATDSSAPPAWMPESPDSQAAPAQSEGTPAWMPESSTPAAAPAPPVQESSTPSWMSQDAGQPAAPQTPQAPVQQAAQPSWMSSDAGQPAQPQQPQFQQPQAVPGMGAAPQVQEDDLLFVVDGAGGGREYPLRSGQRVSVGREATQDIVINDRTLSRNHLIVQRTGERVTVQIIGLNGMVHNGATLKSQSIDLSAPVAFTVGKIPCRIKKKIDSDATILMSSPAASPAPGMGVSPAASPSFQPTPPPGGAGASFQTPAPGGFGSPAPQPQAAAPAMPSTPAPSPGFDDFDTPDFADDTFAGGNEDQFQPVAAPGGGSKKGLIIGGIVVAVLVIGVVLFFLFGGSSDDEAVDLGNDEGAVVEKSADLAPVTVPVDPGQSNDLHGKYYTEAYKLFSDGDPAMACDYLKDIPISSVYREKAENLASEMGNCNL